MMKQVDLNQLPRYERLAAVFVIRALRLGNAILDSRLLRLIGLILGAVGAYPVLQTFLS